MAAMKLACTNLAQASSYSSWDYTTTERAYAGYAGGVRYDATIFRFDVPTLSNSFKGLSVSIAVYNGLGTNPKLRYAVCTSDVNRESYRSTTGTVSDPNQVATGTITLSSVGSTAAKKEFSIQDVKLEGGKTYYLILWAAEMTGVFISAVKSELGNHSVTVSYNGGVVWLKVNGQVKQYMVVVKILGSLKQRIPYVKTSSGIRPGG